MPDSRTWFIVGGLGIFIVLPFLYGAQKAYEWYSKDALLRAVIEEVALIQSYTQDVETRINLDDRVMEVRGMYHIDRDRRMFASFATTTLFIPGEGRPHEFSLENVAIDRDVYTRVRTESDLLSASIPHSETWLHFRSTDIPERFQNIAVPGPILDNLRLFERDGAYLTLVSKTPSDMTFQESLTKFTFHASGEEIFSEDTLAALLERIGNGVIETWVDPETRGVRALRFTNGSYHSTTTIENINTPFAIQAPIATSSGATLSP